MKKLLFALLFLCPLAHATTIFVAQTAGTFSGGTACNGQTAESIATFNSGTETAGQVYELCGAVTTAITLHGSGSSGNAITMLWDTGARLSLPTGQAINVNGGTSFWLFDGGIPCGPGTACDTVEAANLTTYATGQAGIIEATANGTGMTNQQPNSGGFIGCTGCHDIEIRNLIIRNLYIHARTLQNNISSASCTSGACVITCVTACPPAVVGEVFQTASNTLLGSINVTVTASTSTTISFTNGTTTGSGTGGDLADATNSIDSFAATWQCPASGTACGAGTLSIHDSTIHDQGNALEFALTNDTTINMFNLDIYHCNWAVAMDGDGTRTVAFHDNHVHDAANWDTGNIDAFHHNGLHYFMNVPSDSLLQNIYNNLFDGDWGECCTTATSLFVEIDAPNNLNYFNNVVIQFAGNLAPAVEYESTNGAFVNNTFLGVAATSNNVNAVKLWQTTVNTTFENNVIQNYGQYVVINAGSPGATFAVFDYNTYGPIGSSGVDSWQFESTGANSLAAWQTACSCDAHAQHNTNLNLNSTGLQQTGSVVIAAGTNLTTLGISTLDSATTAGNTIAAVARPSTGAWDAGAYEFSSGVVPPPVSITGKVVISGNTVQ
jgi:hypothetical protein